MKDPRRRAISPVERIEQVLADLQSRMNVQRVPLDDWEFRQGRHRAPGQYEADCPWVSYKPGVQWGGEDVTAWFRCHVSIPAGMDGCDVLLRIYPGGEGILRVNQQPVFGFDYNHREYLLTHQAKQGESFSLELECYFRDAPDDALRNDVRFFHCFQEAELIVRDPELESLGYDIRTALDVARAAEESNPELSARLVYTLQKALTGIDGFQSGPVAYGKEAAAARLLLERELFDHGYNRPAGTLDLVGHCHIDLCYTWPYRESVRKNLRTSLIALELMKHCPDYIFSQSQAKLYADLKQYHPDVFAKVKELAAQKRFEPVGGMWVEPDGNIPCGEALVRQILYGRRFFKEELGCESPVCWMPDVFGVCATLPQILVQSGYKLFYTNKQAIWNDTNEFPYNTFWWEGLDGSRIMAHIPPTHFVGKMDPQSLLQQWGEHSEKNQSPVVMYTYGFGDGGGGPTKQMLETAQRLMRMDGLPRLRFSIAEEFTQRIVSQSRDLPVWADELYLEMHRGAQTTKGNLKRLNRQAECALRSAEAFASAAALSGADSYPAARLEAVWKTLLECHFHDAVTGTHCTEAGLEVERAYKDILRQTAEIDRASRQMMMRSGVFEDLRTLYNFSGTSTQGYVLWESETPATLRCGDRSMTTQLLSDGRLLTYVEGIPAFGHQTMQAVPLQAAEPSPFCIEEDRISSPHFEIGFDDSGRISSLLDRDAGRELFSAPGNQFRLYEDKPGRFEAWDIAKDYQRYPVDAIRFLGCKPGQVGELMASRIFRWAAGDKSEITQELIVYARSRRIDFQTRINWQEERKLLRVDFPLALHARFATYEIAFGAIQRSARTSNSYESAKFEVPFHRWMDMGESGYGAALLNNGKYGGCIRNNTASLSLLKAPRYPDTQSDIGIHEFTYSLLPHFGDWQSAGVFQEAVLLNTPIQLVDGAANEPRMDYVKVSAGGISIEALKKAEDGNGWILRLVDYFGQHRRVAVQLPVVVGSVNSCTVMEEPDDSSVSMGAGGFEFTCRPFGIHSFRVGF
jgi:alpha-mannosidase